MKKRVLSCVVVLLLGSPLLATITKQQSAAVWNQTNTTTCRVAFGGSTQLNDLIVVWTTWQSTSTFTASVQDSPQNNTFYSAVGPTLQSAASTPTSAQIFYAKNLQQAGADTVTVTYSGTGTVSSASCVIVEYSGADQNYPLDSVSAGYSTALNPTGLLDSGTVAPANANLLLFGGGTTDYIAALPAPASGFTAIQSTFGSITEQMIVSGNNTLQRATATSSSGNWVMQMAVFRDASWGVTNGWSPVRLGQVQADQFPGADGATQMQSAGASLAAANGLVIAPPNLANTGGTTAHNPVLTTLSATISGNGSLVTFSTSTNPTGVAFVGEAFNVEGSTNYNGDYVVASVTSTGLTANGTTNVGQQSGTIYLNPPTTYLDLRHGFQVTSYGGVRQGSLSGPAAVGPAWVVQ